jgi:hypothetical protein
VHLDVAVEETDSTEIVGTMLGAYQGVNGEDRAP